MVLRYKLQNKYHAQSVTIDGITFKSQLEGLRYTQLKHMQQQGMIKFFLLQPRFDLPGGIKYYGDFLVVENDGAITIEDVKGIETAQFKLKKKQVEALYPITIKILKKGDF